MFLRWISAVSFVWCVFSIVGCVEATSYVTHNKSEKVSSHLLSQPPEKISHEVMANFSDKITLLGYDVDRETLAPGESVTVTWYWQCKEAVGPGWRLFTHVLDQSGRPRLNRDRAGDIRQYYQPEHWRAGMVIRDVQQIRLSKEWDSKIADIRTGIWKGKERLSGVGRGIDASHRGLGPRLEVREKKETKVVIPRAQSVPEIDGVFEGERAWAKSKVLGQFSHTLSGKPAEQKSEVRLMWDDEHLYVAMKAEDSWLSSEYKEHDDELWKADAFEIFIDPMGDKRHYYEMQVNPAGVVFDSYLPSHRKNTNDWTSNLKVKTVLDGTLNDELEDKGWSAEIAIPLASLKAGGGVPPTEDTTWRMNFFLIDKMKDRKRYSAWSPPLRGDFHALDRFGEIAFQFSKSPSAAPADKEGPSADSLKKSASDTGKVSGKRKGARAEQRSRSGPREK